MPDATTKPPVGRHIEAVAEGEAGCLYGIALTLSDLTSSLYAAYETFRYDEGNPVAEHFAACCEQFRQQIELLSLTKDGQLTDNRECSRCSGDGKTTGEDPCYECAGLGYVNAEEADG